VKRGRDYSSGPPATHVALPERFKQAIVGGMKTSVLGRFFLVAAIYIVIFIALVVIQHPLGGPFSLSAGALQLRGRLMTDEQTLDTLELGANGLVFVFSAEKPLRYRTAEGRQVEALPVSYEAGDQGFSIAFDDGSRFSAAADGEGRLSWQAETPVPVAAIDLAYRLSRNAAIVLEEEFDGLYVVSSGTEWSVSNLHAALEADRVELAVSRGRPLAVSMLTRDVAPPPGIVQLLPPVALSDADWTAELSAWRDKAWRALSGPRFNARRVEWSDSAGRQAYSNTALMMHVAELMQRGLYEQANTLITAVRSQHLDEIDWQASAIAGNVAPSQQWREATDRERAAALADQLAAGSLLPFEQSDLIHFVFDRAAPGLSNRVLQQASRLDYDSLDTRQLVAMLEHQSAANAYLSEAENPFAPALAQAGKLVEAIRKLELDYWFVSASEEIPDGVVDTRLSIRAARQLLRLGEETATPLYSIAGQAIIGSLLRQADLNAAIPAGFSLLDGGVQSAGEKYDAEQLYPLLVDAPYYPRAISYYRSITPGTWAWAASPQFAMSRSGEALVFTADYPVGNAHYPTISGIRPFRAIQLYNINYNMDPSFERYNSAGYFYKRSEGVIYVKLSHRADKESIRFIY